MGNLPLPHYLGTLLEKCLNAVYDLLTVFKIFRTLGQEDRCTHNISRNKTYREHMAAWKKCQIK